MPANFTRRTPDLVAKFRRTGRWHLIPLYHFLRLSDFGREGIERSGSYLFADHLYRNHASGRLVIGRWLDRILLNTRAARAMRQRCVQSTQAMAAALESTTGPCRILALPCGIPRDLGDLISHQPEVAARIHYTGMDLDPQLLTAARSHLQSRSPACLPRARFIQGDALNPHDYPAQPMDLVVSTGLGEFLDDPQLRIFYQNVFQTLRPGGAFYTSATTRERGSDYLMRAFELHARYRTQADTAAILGDQPWRSLHFTHDPTGLQTFVRATR